MAKKKYDEKPVREGGGTTTAEEVDANGTPMSMPKGGKDPAEGDMFDEVIEKAQDDLDEAQDKIDYAARRAKRRTLFDEARGEEPEEMWMREETVASKLPEGRWQMEETKRRIPVERWQRAEEEKKKQPVEVMQDSLTRRPYGEHEGNEPEPEKVVEERITRRPYGENEGREPAPEMRFEREVTSRPKMRFEREVTSRPIEEDGGNENKRRSIFDLAREAR